MPLAPLLVVASLLAAGAPDWTPAGTTRGIAVAFRDDPASSVREVRATAELAVPAGRVVALVCDFTRYGAIVDGVQEARTLSGTVPASYEIYLRYAPRFVVVAARDVVVRVRTTPRPDGSG